MDGRHGIVTEALKFGWVEKLLKTDVSILELGCDSLTSFAKSSVRFAC
ncbi:hypothetical protein [Neobacillus sp. OS1-33]|nr:hypothetical protein [Neobacillus sp. OS1-33]WML28037.1 hypothetical protein RCG22_10795 [Neobacillus sp. OS1-33]